MFRLSLAAVVVWLLLAAVGATHLAGTALQSAAEASFPGRDGLLAFAGDHAGAGWKIETFTADGRQVRTVVRGGEFFWSLVEFAPHGRRLLFLRPPRRGDEWHGSLWTLGMAHRRLRRLPIVTPFASWAPDGRHLFYRGRRGQVWRARLDGTQRRFVTPDGEYAYARSPDGRIAAFGYWSEANQRVELGLEDVRTGEFIRTVAANVRGFDFSPDSRRIAYAKDRDFSLPAPECGGTIEIERVDGSAGHALETCPGDPDRQPPSDIAWSPNGRRIAFVRRVLVGEDPEERVYVISSRGGAPKRIYTAYGSVSEDVNGAISWQALPRR